MRDDHRDGRSPLDPPETDDHVVQCCLDDLRKAGFSLHPSAITRMEPGDQPPAPLQRETIQSAPFVRNPRLASSQTSLAASTPTVGSFPVTMRLPATDPANSPCMPQSLPMVVATATQPAMASLYRHGGPTTSVSTPPFVFTSAQRPHLHDGVSAGASTLVTSATVNQVVSQFGAMNNQLVPPQIGGGVSAGLVQVSSPVNFNNLDQQNYAQAASVTAKDATGSGNTLNFNCLPSPNNASLLNNTNNDVTLPPAAPNSFFVSGNGDNHVNNAKHLQSTVHDSLHNTSVPNADSLNNNAFVAATIPTVGNANVSTVPIVTTNVSSVPTVTNASGIHDLNALNNANIGSVLPSGTNPSAAVGGNATVRTLHGLDSINNATVSNNVMPIGDISNYATNIPSSAFGGNSKNNSNNTTTTNNVPSGGGTKNNSNNLTRHRVTFQSNLQPANRANAQVPGNQNQAHEGTGLTKAQKRTLAKKRRREKGKDPIIDVGLGNFSVPQVGDGVGTSTNPLLGFSQPVAPIPISTCNTFTLLQDVNETVLAEGAQTQEVVHDTTLANQAHTQEATTKDFDAELDDHLAKVLDQEGVPQVQSQEEPQVQSQNDTQTPVIAHTPTRANNEDAYSSPTQVEDSSTQGDASSAAPISMGLQTPVREQGTVSPVAHNTKVPVTKRTRRTRSASEQSNVAGFYREASDDDDDSDSSVAGRVVIFESAGRNREFAGGHGSPPKTSKVPFGGRITRSQVRPEQSSAAVGTPISSQSPSF
nr:hypothetical protein Iba_chr05dCG8700 [Ipomoea batatas]